MQIEHLTIQLLWATARLLVTRVSFTTYVVDAFPCYWCKSRELEGRGSPRFPCVTLLVRSLSSDLLRAIISYWSGWHFKSCQTSCQRYTMDLYCENSQRPLHFDYFRKKSPPQMFGWIPDAPLIGGTKLWSVGRL